MARSLATIATAFCCILTAAASAASTDERRFCSRSAPNVLILLDVTTPYDAADKSALIEGRQPNIREAGGRDSPFNADH